MSNFPLPSYQLRQPPNSPATTQWPREKICKVCGDQATGERYGVLACRACESFYTRNKNNIGQCKQSGNCQKSWRCVPCRLKNCVKAGMKYTMYSYHYPNNTRNNMPSTSSSSKFPQPSSSSDPKTCVVCGKKAMGIRYGVPTCANCKVFFCKANKKLPIGDCKKGGNCQLNQRCAPCRFQRCLKAGMGKKVTLGQALVLRILAAYGETCEYTEEKMKQIVEKQCPYPWTPDKSIDPMINRLYAWRAYSMQMNRDIESTGYFIRKLKVKLSSSNRVELFKKHFFQMHMIRITRALSSNGLLLPDGRLIDFEFFNALYGKELAEEMISFTNQALNVFKLDDDCFAMLLTMCFYSEVADNDSILHNIQDPEALENVTQEYRRNFIEWCDEKMAPRTFRNIHLMLEKLKQLDELHTRDVVRFLKQNGQHFDPNTYFANIYLK